MAFPRTRLHATWLARLLGLVFPFARGRGYWSGHAASSVTLERGSAVADLEGSSDSRQRVAQQITEEDERAAGAIAVAGLSTLDMDDLLDRLVTRMVEVSHASVGGILLLDEAKGLLRPGAYHGLSNRDLGNLEIPLGEGFAGRVAVERRPIAISGVQVDFTVVNPYLRERGVRSMLGVPIAVGDRLLGVAHVDRLDNHIFTPVEITRLQGMAAQAALAIYHALLHRQLESANQQLATANQRLHGVISAIPAGVLILDAPHGNVLIANAAAQRMWAHPVSSRGGIAKLQSSLGLYHLSGEPYEPLELPMVRALQKGETTVGEEVVVRQPDGAETIALLSSAPLLGSDGVPEGAVAVFQDTSNLELERLKDQFVSVTAHELFTPLTVVKGTAQLLMRRLNEQGDADGIVVDGLRAIDGRANWMTYLLRKLVDAAELQMGPLNLRRGRVDLVLLAEAVCRRLQLTTGKHEIVCLTNASRLIGLWDRDRLDRVLANLLENAIKYSPNGGRVEVHVDTVYQADPFDPSVGGDGRRWALISVKDTGLGIPRAQQAYLFRRFYRAGPAEYQPSSGLGLGLYISNRIVAAHGGRMTLESEEGQGTTFTFALPVQGDETDAGL